MNLGPRPPRGRGSTQRQTARGGRLPLGLDSVLGLSHAHWFVCSFLVGGLTRRILGRYHQRSQGLDYSPWVGPFRCRALCARSRISLRPLWGVTSDAQSHTGCRSVVRALFAKPAVVPTGNDLRQWCNQQGDPIAEGFCLGYVVGVRDILPEDCVPQTATLSGRAHDVSITCSLSSSLSGTKPRPPHVGH